MFYHVVEMFTK